MKGMNQINQGRKLTEGNEGLKEDLDVGETNKKIRPVVFE